MLTPLPMAYNGGVLISLNKLMLWYIIIAVVVIGLGWYLMKGKKSGGMQPPMQQPPQM